MSRHTSARVSAPRGAAERPGGTESDRASRTVDQCAAELRQARDDARGARETMRRTLRRVEEAEDAWRQATQRLDRAGGPRSTA